MDLFLLLALLCIVLARRANLMHLDKEITIRGEHNGEPVFYFEGKPYEYRSPMQLDCNHGMPVECLSKDECDKLLKIYAEHCKTITAIRLRN